jgi:UDP-glucose 4-epimerase
MNLLDGKRILITGGTGSLGKTLLRRLLTGAAGNFEKVIVLSRDEAKQHALRMEYQHLNASTDEVIYNFSKKIEFRIGDVRNFHSIASALRDVDIVFNAAALKQVPTCEYFPYEAVQTNIGGPENIVNAIRDLSLKVETVVGVSTDKAVSPINVMGMTKSIQERIFARANLEVPNTRFVLVRYGNVLASRGSVIPLFHDQIKAGGPVTITDKAMTRFLLSLEEAVDVIFAALEHGKRGETFIPRIPAAKIIDVAEVLIGDRPIEIKITGIRPGEKMHESLVSPEEIHRTYEKNGYYVIAPILPELASGNKITAVLTKEYSSGDDTISKEQIKELLKTRKLMIEDTLQLEGEFLR